ncbi:uncharacterized protein DUF4249 [Aquimarina sp. MAR_2010_214]|uniref:DUF4249 domain-containing protein n=1 Tax=Aquimarina sp. MAR_2010_214 TaxID=1250026 RepID=UPI000C7143A5|nr:DUF4249 domain-containing protein [Aquimarina sp. MAR_2010_214]PKV51800.1 uncharacterized protein DUF4249 [Aquimarina sp. MAR_2010_214]
MKYFQNIIVLLLSVGLCSCETSVDASDLLKNEQLVIINGYLSPQDTTLKVQVSRSKSRGATTTNSKDMVIKDATVVIVDEAGNEVALRYMDASLNYEAPASDLAIIPGKKYFLRVMAQGKEYKASCIIPIALVQKIEHNIQIKQDEFSGNRLLKVTIGDIKDQRNFYIIGAAVAKSFDNGGGTTNDGVENINFEFKQFATDISRENSVITADGFFTLSAALPNLKLKIQVANAEKILYEALRATYLNNSNNGNSLAEPIIAPNNIEGENGFGVFAGYQLTEKEVTF